MKNLGFFLLISLITVFFSCRREDDLTTDSSARLSFSLDTLTFDTVFTQLGSTTERFTIRNNNDQMVRISSISLREGSNSQFRFNVDGISGYSVKDLEIRGGDSAFVFVEVTVDPTNQSSPLVVLDAIEFETNGNHQEVILEAWGQDAYYYTSLYDVPGFPPLSFISDYYPNQINVLLPNDKPHVIFDYLVVDSLVNLTIQEGTQIHFYRDGGLWAYRGSNLQVQGTMGNEVVFQGYRTEDYYNELPGQWDRIILNESPSDHVFEYAIIKNGYIGISAESYYLDGNFQLAPNNLVLNNTVIQSMEGLGLLTRNYNVKANNSLFVDAQNQLVALLGGGDCDFIHCTLANYWSYGNRQEATVYASNIFEISPYQVVGDLDVYFGNSIIYGSGSEELEADSVDDGDFNLLFDHCAVRTELTESEVSWFSNTLINPESDFGYGNPFFLNLGDDDFSLYSTSVAVDAGDPNITGALTIDLAGNTRDNLPDIGSYEYIP